MVTAETVTGADGSYQFVEVPLGEYTLTVSTPGESEPMHSQTVEVASDTPTTVDPIVVSTKEGLYLPAVQR